MGMNAQTGARGTFAKGATARKIAPLTATTPSARRRSRDPAGMVDTNAPLSSMGSAPMPAYCRTVGRLRSPKSGGGIGSHDSAHLASAGAGFAPLVAAGARLPETFALPARLIRRQRRRLP